VEGAALAMLKTTNIFSGWGVLAGRAGTPLFFLANIKTGESVCNALYISIIF